MNITDSQPVERDNRPYFTAFIGLIIALFGFYILGPLIGTVASIPFMDNGLQDLTSLAADPTSDPKFKTPLFIMQGTAALIGLILMPWFFLYLRKDYPRRSLFPAPYGIIAYVLTAICVITFMGFNSLIIDWNSSVNFPEFMKGFEEWARRYEDTMAEAVEFLTTFDNTGQLILAFIVIAVLPGIGEELVFRGLVQRKLIEAKTNPHIAIWFSAVLFSAIHIQFFGFFPRLFLGALFGYLYFWSKDIRIPMLAHFVNNGFTLLVVYMNQKEIITFDIENEESPKLLSVVIFSIITMVILYFLYRYFNRKHESVEGSF